MHCKTSFVSTFVQVEFWQAEESEDMAEKSNHTYNEGTNLWAVRMSVQVHKLTNLKNGIESHTSSWEMWRQQIWLLNNLEYQTKQVRSVTVTCCQAGLGYCNYMKQKTQDTRLLSHISHKFFCTPYPPSLVRFLLPSHRRPLQPMPPESMPSIEKKRRCMITKWVWLSPHFRS